MRTVLIMCMLIAVSSPRLVLGQEPNAAALQQTIQSLEQSLKEINDRLQALETRVGRLSDTIGRAPADGTLADKVEALSNKLEQVGLPGSGGPFPPAGPKGTVEIQNDWGRPIDVYLNGALWNVPQGLHRFNMPYGPVRFEFKNFHRDRHWVYTERDWKRDGASARLPIQIANPARPGG
jgi:hypothetical protein